MRHAGPAAILALLQSNCVADLPPEGQVVLHIMSDAPLSSTPELAHQGLFDRLRIDVFPPDSDLPCAECTREFVVVGDTLEQGQLTLGIVPVGTNTRVRIQLYRGELDAPSPRRASTIERVVRVTSQPDGFVQHLAVHLLTEDVGMPRGTLDAPLDAVIYHARPVQPWPRAVPRECKSSPQAEEVCIPGGAFWMGDPRLHLAGVSDVQGSHERLVAVSPYFIDRHEVTVGEFRKTGLATDWVPSTDSSKGCTYSIRPAANEELPVNCITWRVAEAYCNALGKHLPTEAQFEYAASHLGQLPYVWGVQHPSCSDAVFARADGGTCSNGSEGPLARGQGARDRLMVSGGEVLDLAGNLSELARDFWQLDDEPCWNGVGVLVDPLCAVPSSSSRIARSLRGGHWASDGQFLRAAVRRYLEGETKAISDLVGFRCVREDP